MRGWMIGVVVLVAGLGAVWGQTHPLVGTWERLDSKGRLEVLSLQEGGRGIKNMDSSEGGIRKIQIVTWSTSDAGKEGSGALKIMAEYKPDEAGVFQLTAGEGLQGSVTYAVSDDGTQLSLVLGGLITEQWTKSSRAIVDPEQATAVTGGSWGRIKRQR